MSKVLKGRQKNLFFIFVSMLVPLHVIAIKRIGVVQVKNGEIVTLSGTSGIYIEGWVPELSCEDEGPLVLHCLNHRCCMHGSCFLTLNTNMFK